MRLIRKCHYCKCMWAILMTMDSGDLPVENPISCFLSFVVLAISCGCGHTAYCSPLLFDYHLKWAGMLSFGQWQRLQLSKNQRQEGWLKYWESGPDYGPFPG